MLAKFLMENFNERNGLEYQSINGTVILTWVLENGVMRV